MKITINGTERELKFTFNSFRYLEEFQIEELSDIATKPFKVGRVTTDLLYGALNYDPRTKIEFADVVEYVQSVYENEDGDIFELLSQLMEELGNSGFFKQLQKSTKTVKKSTKK